MTFNILIAATGLLAFAYLSFGKGMSNKLWRAAITPLASIIGSGFLIVGPILQHSFGYWAPAAMLLLCAISFAFGWAIRSNISHIGTAHGVTMPNHQLEQVSSLLLSFAYFISVAYYLNLFGAFFVRLTPFNSTLNGQIATSGAFLIILAIGVLRGFSALEGVEKLAVSLKLAVIAAFIFALSFFFQQKTVANELIMLPVNMSGLGSITLILGLIITVQGFETSRYLGEEYSPSTRIKSMRLAQYVAAAIYMAYILLMTYTLGFDSDVISETAIISMTERVASILPYLLVLAALSAQFSAAIADTSGAAGLLQELGRTKVTQKTGYYLVAGIGLVLTWAMDIFSIIGLASRAFALYYALQSFIAFRNAARTYKPLSAAAFLLLTLLGLAAAIFATSVEG